MASINGKHMVLRGYSDTEERRAFVAAFPDLSADERDNAHASRRIHKQTTVLLHELGHNLGAQHDERDSETMMSPSYAHHASAFRPETLARIQRTLNVRLGRATPEEIQVVQAAATMPPPARDARPHQKLIVHVTKAAILIEGREYDADEANIVFGTQAGIDPETDVIIDKDKDVPREVVVKLVERAQAQGLKHVMFKWSLQ